MKNKFLKGLLKGLLYYAVGLATAWLTFLLFGWEYKHAPGLHHIVGLLFLLGGTVRTLYYIVLLFAGPREKINFGILIINLGILLSIILFTYISITTEDTAEYRIDPNDIITINRNDTLNLIKGDTFVIDKIYNDSTNHR